ncbi:MAG: ATP-dependent RNA helicase RhlB [Pseudohongiellaceae bacterium]
MNDEQNDVIEKVQKPVQALEGKQRDDKDGGREDSEDSKGNIQLTNTINIESQTRFTEFDLAPSLLKAFVELGFEFCTPIQAQSLKVTMEGHDVTGKAQTGTGKTAAFLTTIINYQLKKPISEDRYVAEPRALIIAPTRELVMQIAKDALALTKYTGLHVQTLVGGIDYQKQQEQLEQTIVDIVVATPGRLIDFAGRKKIDLSYVETLVIDEADRMLDMGFIPQVRQIIAACPKKEFRQTMLYSATFADDILTLGERWAHNPIRIEVEPGKVTTENIDQKVYLVTTEEKYKLLYNLILLDGSERVIVFTNRRDQARKLADNLYRNGIKTGLLTGEIAQQKRLRTLENFRTANIQVLVATDVAGRGLHIEDISHVVNFTLPLEAEDYVHRIGRTGRAGAEGTSISFACEDDSFLLPDIEEKIGKKLNCEYPDVALLSDPPAFSRSSKFKADKSYDNKKGKHQRRR